MCWSGRSGVPRRSWCSGALTEEDRLGALTTYVAFVRQNRKKFERLRYSRRWVQIEGMLVEAVTVYLAQSGAQ